jgi:fructose-1,6-bisphosphatase II / sedoheptulose-1,7-bisphosphatase
MSLTDLLDNFNKIVSYTAYAASKQIGLGDNQQADQIAVNKMREMLNLCAIDGRVVIGEGERDCAPMLYVGEKIGLANAGQPKIDIAVDPLEGTNLCSKALNGSLAVLAAAPANSLLHAPDVYMRKIACGVKIDGISLNLSLTENIHIIAKSLNKKIKDLKICILDRPRHQELVTELRSLNVKIYFIEDGDILAALATSRLFNHYDAYIGIGGAPEGVLAAAALKILGGSFQGILQFNEEEEIERAQEMGITNLDREYHIDDLANDDVIFCAAAVTDNQYMKGVRIKADYAMIDSLTLHYNNKIIEKRTNYIALNEIELN